jgi:cytochrome c oxidase subunit 2
MNVPAATTPPRLDAAIAPTRVARAFAAASVAAVTGGCAVEWQSALHPRGHEADHILDLFLAFAAVCTFVFVLVVGALALALLRRRVHGEPRTERALSRGLGGWAAFIATTLFVLTVASYAVDRRIALASEAPAVKVRMTAHQWWWAVEYQHGNPSLSFQTANELRLPVGRTTIVELRSPDVIHSFWIPNLHGKQDMIPGRVSEIRLSPTHVGRYRAECAEFCGLQHAHMAFDVAVVPVRDFEAWRDAMLKPGKQPSTPAEQRGHDYFVTRECASCHQIRGTIAGGRVGPELTHFGSRASIAAGTLPNGPGSLAAWLADPQHVKPGAHMPDLDLGADDLGALTAYLQSLR